MKARIGPRRWNGKSRKVWNEPLLSIYVGVTLAIILASAVRLLIDR